VIVLCSRWTADPAAAYFPVTLRPVVVNALNAEHLMVLNKPRDDVLFDDFARWCGRVAVVTAITQVLSCTESVRAPCGAAADRPASVATEVPESPALLEVLADLAQIWRTGVKWVPWRVPLPAVISQGFFPMIGVTSSPRRAAMPLPTA
jgi:hypothetical protein